MAAQAENWETGKALFEAAREEDPQQRRLAVGQIKVKSGNATLPRSELAKLEGYHCERLPAHRARGCAAAAET